ncbi:MAG: exodeoxyribonuclease VII large subunit [Deltaproteobacteria bacterium]|nr:exodeoxyribonuclease VII large subunit [Deltaproteobacteria bacterium]
MPNIPKPPSEEKAFSVSQVNTQIASQLKILGRILMEGEVSSVTFHRSNHWYFDLKDDTSVISCVMYKNNNKSMTWRPKEGDKIRVSGKLDVYGRTGRISFVVYRMSRSGLGEYLLRLEELKKKLLKEGLFDPTKKRPIPRYPKSIGVATSATGAALQDIRKVINDRFPHVTLYLVNCKVEGKDAPQSIISAIDLLNRHNKSDVIIVGRGGGSKESLMAFNEESVVRAIAASNIPIIAAVGHEVDSSLSDFAADLRAATPSHAAEYAVPFLREELQRIRGQEIQLHRRMDTILREKYYQKTGCTLRDPIERIEQLAMRVENLQSQMNQLMDRIIREKGEQLKVLRPTDPVQRIDTAIVRCNELERRLQQQIDQHIQRKQESLDGMKLPSPNADIDRAFVRVEQLQQLLIRNIDLLQKNKQARLAKQVLGLDSLSPLSILLRGYSVALKDGKAVLDGDSLQEGDRLSIRFAKGQAQVRVEDPREVWIQEGLFSKDE